MLFKTSIRNRRNPWKLFWNSLSSFVFSLLFSSTFYSMDKVAKANTRAGWVFVVVVCLFFLT